MTRKTGLGARCKGVAEGLLPWTQGDERGASRPCPLCGSRGRRRLIAWDRNRETTAERFRYDRCVECATVFIAQPPADLGSYYAGDYYNFDADGQPAWKRSPLLIRSEEYRVSLLLRHVRRGRLIEIGSGAGGFASAANAAGFAVTAVEMDRRCCEYLEQDMGVETICSDRPVEVLSGLPRAEVIALWHVLEHLIDPAELLAVAADRLAPGGMLALGLPNPDSLQFRLLGRRWAHLDAPRHLSLMPAWAVIAHVGALGLTPVELTSRDPCGLLCNMFGWTYAMRWRPAAAPTRAPTVTAARLVNALLAPIERSDLRGTAMLLLLRKDR